MKVFISGSISIKNMPSSALTELNKIIDIGHEILVGDARGVDYMVQKLLSEKSYRSVVVYHTGYVARHNVSNWVTKSIFAKNNEKGRALHTLKDEAMAQDADFGLMVWDGKSKGTFNNMLEMKRLNKSFIVIENGAVCKSDYIESLLKTTSEKQLELALY